MDMASTRPAKLFKLVVGALLLLVAAGSVMLSQQFPLAAPGAETVATASIEGVVVRVGGELLGKARVMLRSVEGRSPLYGAVTDASGGFTLANIEAGDYRLHVERDGYVDQQYGQISPSRPGTVLVIANGQEVRDVVIGLIPTGTIAGRVYDEDGEPIVGANVRALRYDYDDGEKVLRPVGQAQTNDLGEYRLYWLTPGEYQVAATFEARFRAAAGLREAVLAADPAIADFIGQLAAGGGTGGGRGGPAVGRGAILEQLVGQFEDPLDQIYVDTYYPGTNDPAGAAPVQVGAGVEVRAVDFTVLPTRAVTVSGRVVGPYSPDDGLIPNVTLVPQNSVLPAGRNRSGRGGRGGAERDGTFSLTGVTPGAYTIVASVRGRGRGNAGQPELTGFADLQVGGSDLDGVTVPVQQSVPLRGRVLVDQTAAEINVSRLRVRLQPTRSLPVGSPNGRVGEDGAFVIENVSPTAYRVSLTGLPEDAYVSGARVGAVDVLTSGLTMDADTGLLEFEVSGAGSRIEGTVRVAGDRAFTGAQVVLIPSDPGRDDLYQEAGVDQYGRFSIRGVAPGRYRVFAWEDAPSGAYRDPEFVRRYDDFGEPVEVEQGIYLQIQPLLIPAG